MPIFTVRVTIENLPGMSDPEGDTILGDLVLRGGRSSVKQIRTAKALKFSVDAMDADSALDIIREICEEMRIYNPLVSRAETEVLAGSN